MQNNPNRRGSLTDPLLHAHTSLPGSADGPRRDSNESFASSFPSGVASAASGDSHDRQASVASAALTHSPLSPAGGFAAQIAPAYSLGNYNWAPPGSTSGDFSGATKRKSTPGMDDSDPKRRASLASLDGHRLSALSLDAERRASITSTASGWTGSTSGGSGSGAYPWPAQPPRQVQQFAFNAPNMPNNSGIVDQLNNYNFGASCLLSI